jgi:hypothetical protein
MCCGRSLAVMRPIYAAPHLSRHILWPACFLLLLLYDPMHDSTFFCRQRVFRFIAPPRLNCVEAPSCAHLRRVMCSIVAYSSGLLSRPPQTSSYGSKLHIRAAEGIMHRVYSGYRFKAQVRLQRLASRCSNIFHLLFVFVVVRTHPI